jgi:hypothetical protein
MNFGVIRQICEGVAEGSIFLNRAGHIVDYETSRIIPSLNPDLFSTAFSLRYQPSQSRDYTLTDHIFARRHRKFDERV